MVNLVWPNTANGTSILDTPVNVAGWTVQNPATGSNQNTVGNAPPTGVLPTSQVAAQTALGTVASTQAGTQSIAAAVDALNAALVASGIQV
jgi:hypothetical protein